MGSYRKGYQYNEQNAEGDSYQAGLYAIRWNAICFCSYCQQADVRNHSSQKHVQGKQYRHSFFNQFLFHNAYHPFDQKVSALTKAFRCLLLMNRRISKFLLYIDTEDAVTYFSIATISDAPSFDLSFFLTACVIYFYLYIRNNTVKCIRKPTYKDFESKLS